MLFAILNITFIKTRLSNFLISNYLHILYLFVFMLWIRLNKKWAGIISMWNCTISEELSHLNSDIPPCGEVFHNVFSNCTLIFSFNTEVVASFPLPSTSATEKSRMELDRKTLVVNRCRSFKRKQTRISGLKCFTCDVTYSSILLISRIIQIKIIGYIERKSCSVSTQLTLTILSVSSSRSKRQRSFQIIMPHQTFSQNHWSKNDFFTKI